MITRASREIIRTVAAERGVLVEELTGACRKWRVFRARIEVAYRLSAIGYSSPKIGRCLSKDHSTILFYLGRRTIKPSPNPRWHRPRIKLLEQISRRRYLVPYAGAGPNYEWKERA